MYKVVGVDQREYGPVTRETILEWIAQNRANAQTIARFEDGPWKPLAAFEEFQAALAEKPQSPPTASPIYTSAEAPPFSGVGSRRETNIASVLGLIFPILCCWCCYVGPLLGIVFSSIGWSQIRANPNKYSTNEALPKIGLGLGIFMLLVHIVLQLLDAKVAKYLPQLPKGF